MLTFNEECIAYIIGIMRYRTSISECIMFHAFIYHDLGFKLFV